tara:strand:- start:164 stop:298 length:135 start_codon:yes stop_codon:yes gene_type:complete
VNNKVEMGVQEKHHLSQVQALLVGVAEEEVHLMVDYTDQIMVTL